MGRFTIEKPFQTKEVFVFETIRDAILHLRLAPGEKLVVDHLSVELGVSPIPIRSALQRLESEGLVRIIPFTGAVVAEVTPQEVDEIFAILEALERVAFETAASHFQDARTGGLESLLAQMDAAVAVRDFDTWSDLNRQFHQTMSEISEMKLLADFTRRAFDRWDRLRRTYFQAGMPDRIAEAQQQHHQMIGYLRAGDAEALGQLITLHNRAARKTYSQIYG